MSVDRPAHLPPAGRPWRYLLTGAPCDSDAFRLREHRDRRISGPARVAISVLVRGVAITMRTRFGISTAGVLPPSGCVLVSHHGSYWDGVFAAALDPRVVPITSGRWRAVPVVGWILDSYGVLWAGDHAVETATGLVGKGNACWVAPRAYERDRQGENPAHLGAARICVGALVPVVPMELRGLTRTERARRPRSAATVVIGEPVWPGLGESAAAFSARLEATLPRASY